jgi:hypothetical protein
MIWMMIFRFDVSALDFGSKGASQAIAGPFLSPDCWLMLKEFDILAEM